VVASVSLLPVVVRDDGEADAEATVAVETLEGARLAGVPLSDYAKAKGLARRPVYDAIEAQHDLVQTPSNFWMIL